MKLIFSILLVLFCIDINAQAPPVIQWQKCFGGTGFDGGTSIQQTPDGGMIMCGTSNSNDGDVSGNHNGSYDVWVVKTDINGNIQWQRSYGGSGVDRGYQITKTPDNGYIILAVTSSNDGDVSGNHSSVEDIWVVKIDPLGNIQWQRCYGGTRKDLPGSIISTFDGGYLIGGSTNSLDGDVAGYHVSTVTGIPPLDTWILKIDAVGNLLWQTCIGGTGDDYSAQITNSSEGGYFCATGTLSTDGDVDCPGSGNGKMFIFKLDNTGNIQWKLCWGAWNTQGGQGVADVQQAPDGNYFVAGGGTTYLGAPTYGSLDIFLIKISPAGILLWSSKYGGSFYDGASELVLNNDGSIILAGSTLSSDHDVCTNFGSFDFWVMKLSSTGSLLWQKTYGGSNGDGSTEIIATQDGGFIVFGYTDSNDFDVSGNHGGTDFWLVKLSFPGIPVLPSISIAADKISICPGQPIMFVATPTDGGATPSYQWQINGINAGINNDTVIFNTLNDSDSVSCILTSNARCLTSPLAESNKIGITVDNSRGPSGFLPADTTMCLFDEFELKPVGIFAKYQWNTNAITQTLMVTTPGTFWLLVTTNEGCTGRDTILVTSKECLKGFYMPTGFTPNGDGRNDLLKPFIAGRILQYKLTIINRWGQVVFQTSEPGKGWDGMYKGKRQNNDVFVWTCAYQFAGEEVKLERGTVVVIR